MVKFNFEFSFRNCARYGALEGGLFSPRRVTGVLSVTLYRCSGDHDGRGPDGGGRPGLGLVDVVVRSPDPPRGGGRGGGNGRGGKLPQVGTFPDGHRSLHQDGGHTLQSESAVIVLTRGHSLALVKSHSRLDIRKYTFSQRVVNDWKKLPEECINATSVNMFKNKIDQYYLKTRRE